MPEIIKINFPQFLNHEQQVELEALVELLRKFSSGLEFIFQDSYLVEIVYANNWTDEFIYKIDLPQQQKKISLAMMRQWISILQLVSRINTIKLSVSEINLYPLRMQKRRLSSSFFNGLTKKVGLVQSPVWSFSNLILEDSIIKKINRAINIYKKRDLIFDVWEIGKIKPQKNVLINLSGPPGTGKTSAAHSIAAGLGINIICLSYSQIESKYVGEGPKNLSLAFENAMSENALLFFDEADSLLGRRITNVTDSADQAINSMRSQMIIELDRYQGVAVFATNLLKNYDKSFINRLLTIEIPLPNERLRREMFIKFIGKKIPGASELKELEFDELAAISDGLSGRDIRDVILLAATELAMNEKETLGNVLKNVLKEYSDNLTKKGEN